MVFNSQQLLLLFPLHVLFQIPPPCSLYTPDPPPLSSTSSSMAIQHWLLPVGVCLPQLLPLPSHLALVNCKLYETRNFSFYASGLTID